MKLIDVIAAVIIFAISSVCFLQGYTYVEKNRTGVTKSSEDSSVILKTDYLIRKKIKAIKIPYWKNFSNQIENEMITIGSSQFKEDIKIISVEIIKKGKTINGLKVLWSYKDKKFETIEELSSRTFIE